LIYDQAKKESTYLYHSRSNLAVLRAQDGKYLNEHLAAAVNIFAIRTYSSFETQKRQMSWPIYGIDFIFW